MQEPPHDLHDESFEPNIQVKKESDFTALIRFNEPSAESTDMALPIKLEEDAVPFVTPASKLRSGQVQHTKMEDEILSQLALLPYWSDSRQWRPVKLEDGGLSPTTSKDSKPQIHQVKSVKVEEISLPFKVPVSTFEPHTGLFHKQSSIGLANDSTLRNKPSGVRKKDGTKQHSRKRAQRIEEDRSSRQRKRRTHQRELRRFVREGAPKPQLFSAVHEDAGKGCPRKGPNAEPLGKKRFEDRDRW